MIDKFRDIQSIAEFDFMADIERLIALVPSPLMDDDFKAFSIVLDDVYRYAKSKIVPFHKLKINVK